MVTGPTSVQQEPNTEERRKREVSRYPFPYYDLESCIEIARALHDKAGGKASLVQLASYLGHKDEFSGALRARVWGAQLFGLVLIEKSTISTTPLGEQLVAGTTGVQRDRRLAQAFLNVPLFREVFKRYENSSLPSTRDGLKQALREQFGVPMSLLSQAAKTLERSADEAGFKREDHNRLIHPVPIGLIEKELADSASQTGVSSPGSAQVNPEKQYPNAPHPAISGFLQALPNIDNRWTEAERQRWLDAFVALVKALHPTKDES